MTKRPMIALLLLLALCHTAMITVAADDAGSAAPSSSAENADVEAESA